MPRDIHVFLDDIVEACGKIIRYTSGLSFDQFHSNEKTIDAVVRNLEIIGEAAKKLPDETRNEMPLDWKRISGLRDVLIHQYFGIDVEIIWDIVQTKVPELSERVHEFLNRG